MGSERRNINGSIRGDLSSVKLIKCGDIPEWMVFQVLVRLPVKVLFKFKIVSKPWLSMISDPSFARLYVARTSRLRHSQPWTLIHCLVHESTTKHLVVPKLPLGTDCPPMLILPRIQKASVHMILAISNGLVLYSPYVPWVDRSSRLYYANICNPITRQWATLPPSEHCVEVFSTGFVTQVEDNILASYRVVRIHAYNFTSVFRFEVYFSETGKWMDFNIGFDQEIFFIQCKKSVALGKILHWMISGHRILSYNPYDKPESFRFISLPCVSDTSYQMNKIMLDEHQGHLRYFEVELDTFGPPVVVSNILSIWVLNDYDLGEWCLQHKVNIDHIQFDGGLSLTLPPLSFHPFDPNIVYVDNDNALYSYDIKTRKLETLDVSRNYYNYYQFHSVWSFSFVIPPWPVSINP